MSDHLSVTASHSSDSTIRHLLERAEIEGVELVRFLYVDHSGVTRGKSTSRAQLAERLRSGLGHTVASMAMNMLDELQPVEHLGPVGEARLIADPATYVPLPYSPGAAAMLADLRQLDGSPWAACPRTFLKDAIAALADDGYALKAAFEPEFTLGHRQPGPDGGPDRLVPHDDSLAYAGTGFDQAHDYAMRLTRTLQTQGLGVEQYHPEAGHGQQELSIRHAPALRAADNHVIYRESARGVALRMSMWASLAPKPVADQLGNGNHLHLSLWDADLTQNLFADRPGLMGNFVGGILAHLPALTALTCASVNSYRRLTPRSWAGAYAVHGPDNREAAVRVCSPLGAHGEPNIELKTSDSSANPYLALGAVIHAGLDGLRRRLDPGPPVLVDPDTQPGAHRRLPTSLPEALDALAADEVLMEALGPLRADAYLTVKRSEAAAFAERDEAFELYAHLRAF